MHIDMDRGVIHVDTLFVHIYLSWLLMPKDPSRRSETFSITLWRLRKKWMPCRVEYLYLHCLIAMIHTSNDQQHNMQVIHFPSTNCSLPLYRKVGLPQNAVTQRIAASQIMGKAAPLRYLHLSKSGNDLGRKNVWKDPSFRGLCCTVQ
jgi:hypothetical protein